MKAYIVNISKEQEQKLFEIAKKENILVATLVQKLLEESLKKLETDKKE